MFRRWHRKVYEYGKAGNIEQAVKWGEILDGVCRLYPMAKSQTSSTKYAMSKLGFLDRRVIRPTEPITAEEMAKIDAHIEKYREYAAIPE